MEPFTLVILIGLGLLLLPCLMQVAEAIVTVIRVRITSILLSLAALARQAFVWAARLLTEDGTLSLAETTAQVAQAR